MLSASRKGKLLVLAGVFLVVLAILALAPRQSLAVICWQLNWVSCTGGPCSVTSCSTTPCTQPILFWYCPGGTTENKQIGFGSVQGCKDMPTGWTQCTTNFPNAPPTMWCTQTFACDTTSQCTVVAGAGRFCSSLPGAPGGGQCGLSWASLQGTPYCPY